jgi:hypothetical protein
MDANKKTFRKTAPSEAASQAKPNRTPNRTAKPHNAAEPLFQPFRYSALQPFLRTSL